MRKCPGVGSGVGVLVEVFVAVGVMVGVGVCVGVTFGLGVLLARGVGVCVGDGVPSAQAVTACCTALAAFAIAPVVTKPFSAGVFAPLERTVSLRRVMSRVGHAA